MSIQSILPEELRQYVRTRHENDYRVVDVRQPEEYQAGHIPGARLLPLPELMQGVNQLPGEKELIFYCHSGGRSMAAAVMAEEEGIQGPVYNLTGGIMAWDGGQVAGEPRVEIFADQTLTEMFKTAMNLEKGAALFYGAVRETWSDEAWGSVFAELAKAEKGHARSVHSLWQAMEPQIPPFETLFEGLSGEILEGGLPLEEALNSLTEIREGACMRLIEMALKIEYAAYDLYRTLTDQRLEPPVVRALTSLCQAEKGHMQSLTRAIGLCAGPNPSLA